MKSQPATTVEPPPVDLPPVDLPLVQPPPPCQTNAGPPSDSQRVARLLAVFDAAALGEGDVVAGANVLAAMACSLANIHRPGSGLVTEQGERLAVGTSLLISGSHSSSLVGEKIISGLGTHQNNFIAHLRDWTLSADMELAKPLNIRNFNPVAMLEEGTSSSLFDLHNNSRTPGFADSYFYEDLILPPRRHGKRDLHTRPLVYITAGKPAELARSLEHSHLGHPFIHVGIHDPATCSRFDEVCAAVMDGTLTVGSLSETVQGFVIATDRSNTLAEVVRAGDGKGAGWLMRTLWLTDSAAGPEPGNIQPDEATVKLDRIQARYDAAMKKAWVARLDYTNAVPNAVKFDWPKSQAKWITFLKGMEAELPGITGSARSLLATLVFGLRGVVSISKLADGFIWHTDDVAALARWLIRRMANARSAMLHTERRARMQRLHSNMIHKLTDRPPMSVREITRTFNNLCAADCLEVLLHLQAQGSVARSDDKWCLASLVSNTPELQPLTINV